MSHKQDKFTLYSYWRSSCSQRVRIALNLLGIEYSYKAINLLKNEQTSEEYLAINPSGLVPALIIEHADGSRELFNQSIAIIEYLWQTYGLSESQHQLVPSNPKDAYRARSLALMLACEIQPVGNLRVLQAVAKLTNDDASKGAWSKRVHTQGLEAFEEALKRHNEQTSTVSRFSCGDYITIADCALVPVFFNAMRWKVDVDQFPLTKAIVDHLNEVDEVKKAAPEAQPDAVL